MELQRTCDSHRGFRAVVSASLSAPPENTNGKAGEQVLADPPDIILMDIFMPEFDGIEATQQIKTNPRFRHIPVIAFTAKSPLSNSAAGLFAATLTKPCSPAVLLETVGKWTDSTRRLQHGRD